MRIVYDYQFFAAQSYGGITRYLVRLAQQLTEMGEDPHILAPLYKSQYLNELPPETVHGTDFSRWSAGNPRSFQLLNFVLSKARIGALEPDIFHETYYTNRVVNSRAKARFLTVHDMIHEKYMQDFLPRDPAILFKRMAVRRADHVICVSENTKKDLCALFGTPEEKISVVPLGFDRLPHVAALPAADTAMRPFLLYVGNRPGYKNFTGLLEAVKSSPQLMKDFDIVAFGGGAFSLEENAQISRLGYREGAVRQVGGDDAVLGRLYASAAGFVFPSLYEGFGLPPLEAMACGCPVISSNAGPMPEVIGEAAAFFDPASAEDMAAAIAAVVYSPARRRAFIRAGGDRIQHFSWEKCATQTREAYARFV